MERKFKVSLDEEELKAVIRYHTKIMTFEIDSLSIETSFRIHDLTKRLNRKDEPEIENTVATEEKKAGW